MKRRHFLTGSAVTLTGMAAGVAFTLRDRSRHGTLLSAFEDARGDQYVDYRNAMIKFLSE